MSGEKESTDPGRDVVLGDGRLGDRLPAEEIVQEALLEMWLHRDSFDPARGSLADWARAIVRHLAALGWRLYLAGGALAFEQGRMGVDQVLATRPAVMAR